MIEIFGTNESVNIEFSCMVFRKLLNQNATNYGSYHFVQHRSMDVKRQQN